MALHICRTWRSGFLGSQAMACKINLVESSSINVEGGRGLVIQLLVPTLKRPRTLTSDHWNRQ